VFGGNGKNGKAYLNVSLSPSNGVGELIKRPIIAEIGSRNSVFF